MPEARSSNVGPAGPPTAASAASPAAAPTPRVAHVALASPGDATRNTLVLGADLVIPLERDLDGDPFQDDVIHLTSADGHIARTMRSTDPDVSFDAATSLLFYRFRGLPYGVYHVAVETAERPVDVIRGLVFRREGMFVGGAALPSARKGDPIAPAEIEDPPAVSDDIFEDPDDGSSIDQPDQDRQ